jgi:hypothetical protein
MRHAYFHEDDYCQIEIIPIENLKFCLEQAGKIAEFSEKHRNGIGWDKIYLREENPKKISELNITIEKIREAFQEKLPEYDEVYTGYSSERILCNNTYAFGVDQGEILFLETDENGKLTSLWCSEPTTDLYCLPNYERFLLADWCWEFICPLADKATIEKYLTERERVFSEITKKWEEQRKKENKKWWKFWQ